MAKKHGKNGSPGRKKQVDLKQDDQKPGYLFPILVRMEFIIAATLYTISRGDLDTTRLLIRGWLTLCVLFCVISLPTRHLIRIVLLFDPTEGELDWQTVRDEQNKESYRTDFLHAVNTADRFVVTACLLMWPGCYLLPYQGFAHCLARSRRLLTVIHIVYNCLLVFSPISHQARIWMVWRELSSEQRSGIRQSFEKRPAKTLKEFSADIARKYHLEEPEPCILDSLSLRMLPAPTDRHDSAVGDTNGP